MNKSINYYTNIICKAQSMNKNNVGIREAIMQFIILNDNSKLKRYGYNNLEEIEGFK